MIYDDYKNLLEKIKQDNIEDAKKVLRKMVLEHFKAQIPELSVEEMLEILPDESYDIFDFDPMNGEDWEDE